LKASIQPDSYCDGNKCRTGPNRVGDSIGRGSYSFTAGNWTNICQTVKLNKKGSNNGSIQVVVDGKLAISLDDLMIHNGAGFTGIIFHNFFGGSGSSWASPKNQNVYFSNFQVTAQ
jgi:hypothetical protein